MRMSVRLAVASTFVVTAVVGGLATAASASDLSGKRQLNDCSNDRHKIAADSVNSGEAAGEKKSGEQKVVVCQAGRENSVVNYHKGDVHYHEGNVIGRDATAPLTEAVRAATPRGSLEF